MIQVIDEIQGYNPERVKMKTERIHGRLLYIFEMAKKEGILPLEAANRYGNSRQGCESNGVKVPCRQLPDSDG